MTEENIIIRDRIYRKNQGENTFQIPFGELENICFFDIPEHYTVEITPTTPIAGVFLDLRAVNPGEYQGKHELILYGGILVIANSNKEALYKLDLLQRIFPKIPPDKIPFSNPKFSINEIGGRKSASVNFSIDFSGKGKVLLREAAAPIYDVYERLSGPEIRLFICHASEDKSKARKLASYLKSTGANVWFDEWEIKVGESIVDKINAALSSITHLIILLSKDSSQKPWVVKEFSVALMRQLSDHSVTVLPVRLDNSPIPTIIGDIRYADCRKSLEGGFRQIEESILYHKQKQ